MSRTRPFARLAAAALASALATGAQAQATQRAGHFAEPARSTASADIAVDAAGGLHMAYVHYEPSAEGASAVYAFCAGGPEACADVTAWSTVQLGSATRDVQVAARPDGRPRLLISAESQTQGGGTDYIYAECEGACDQAASWTLTVVATSWDNSISSFLSDRLPQRSFLLDPAGRPMFLYSDRNYLVEPDHYGTFWMACKAACTDRANWRETDLAHHAAYDTEIFDEPALALDPAGRPRVAGRIFAMTETGEDAPDGLYYLACDSACTTVAGWRRTWVNEVGGGSYPSPTWDLAIDPQGRPRIALFTGDGMEQSEFTHSLIYFWCDVANCTESDQVWNGSAVIAGEGHGEMAALALDASGNPRLAFRTSSGELGYAWCDEACTTPETAAWQATFVEGQADLSVERPTALPFTCDGELWEGLAPQLALGSDGRPLVAYDVSVEGRCLYQEFGDPQITYDFHQLWRGARLVTFQP